VWEHSSDSLPEDSGWGTVVNVSVSRVGSCSLSEVGQEDELVSNEFTADVDSFSSDCNNFLSFE